MDVITRLKTYLSDNEITPRSFAIKCGIDPSNFQKMLKGEQVISEKTIKKISANSLLNRDWLITGKGERLKEPDGNSLFLGTARPAIQEDTIPVRFFEVSPTATFQEFCSGMSEQPSTINILPNSHESIDDSYCVFEVCGESMAPQIQNKARVLCKEITPTRWHSLRDGVIVIAYADKFVIKRVAKNRLEAENFILLSSDNPNYPDTDKAYLGDIRCVFKAVRVISQPIF